MTRSCRIRRAICPHPSSIGGRAASSGRTGKTNCGWATWIPSRAHSILSTAGDRSSTLPYASVGQVGNTPRYTYGSDQAAIVYTKLSGTDFQLATALETAPDTWQITLLTDGLDRWRTEGTPEETTGPAMIAYNRETAGGDVVVSWRELADPASERTANVIAQGGRFLGAEPALLVLNHDENHIVQVFLVPFDTGQPEQITFGDRDKENAFIWWAPEYQEYIFTVMVEFSELAFYRRIDGVWTNFYQFAMPNGKPFLSSPEGFAYNGRSFVSIVSCDELGAGGFQGQPNGPSEIWVTGIDPENPFFRRIDDPSYLARRSEPEPYMLDSEPAVYYTETPEGGSILVKRAMTGLSADGDTDGVPDVTDNCLLLPNADQRDTNGDRYGNLCDPDLERQRHRQLPRSRVVQASVLHKRSRRRLQRRRRRERHRPGDAAGLLLHATGSERTRAIGRRSVGCGTSRISAAKPSP
jgi:hypothetical protein